LIAKAHKLAPSNTDVIVLMARLSIRQSSDEDAWRFVVGDLTGDHQSQISNHKSPMSRGVLSAIPCAETRG
jgi:hypothetical protein